MKMPLSFRTARKEDIPAILNLLSQVLEVHATVRPDLFISGTTKYDEKELAEKLDREDERIFVALNDAGDVIAYAFCVIQDGIAARCIVPRRTFYIDDFCVSEKSRGRGVGKALFNYVKHEAELLDCYDITLNVWEGNDSARKFYENVGMKPEKTQMEYIL